MRQMLYILVLFCMMSVSCEKYEDGRPSKDVRTEFAKMYPDAWDVEWEFEGNMWKVSFETGTRPDGIDNEALYDMDGNWIKTITDVFLASVPQNIMGYLQLSEFASGSFRDDDAEYIRTPEGNFYRFDISFDGRNIEVDVTEDGKVSQSVYGFW